MQNLGLVISLHVERMEGCKPFHDAVCSVLFAQISDLTAVSVPSDLHEEPLVTLIFRGGALLLVVPVDVVQ